MDILWIRRSRVSKAKHLKGCIKKLPGSSLVLGGGGWERQGGLVGEGIVREARWVVQVLNHRKASTEKV